MLWSAGMSQGSYTIVGAIRGIGSAFEQTLDIKHSAFL